MLGTKNPTYYSNQSPQNLGEIPHPGHPKSKAAASAAVINALPKDQPQLVAEVFAEMKSRLFGGNGAGGRADHGWKLGFCLHHFVFLFIVKVML